MATSRRTAPVYLHYTVLSCFVKHRFVNKSVE